MPSKVVQSADGPNELNSHSGFESNTYTLHTFCLPSLPSSLPLVLPLLLPPLLPLSLGPSSPVLLLSADLRNANDVSSVRTQTSSFATHGCGFVASNLAFQFLK